MGNNRREVRFWRAYDFSLFQPLMPAQIGILQTIVGVHCASQHFVGNRKEQRSVSLKGLIRVHFILLPCPKRAEGISTASELCMYLCKHMFSLRRKRQVYCDISVATSAFGNIPIA